MITSITIPLRLVSEANSTEHWSKKAKRHKEQHLVVKAYLNQLSGNSRQLPCTVTLIRCAPRKFDDDNLQSAFKHIRDIIAHVITQSNRLGQGDNDERIKWIYKQKTTKDKEHYITIQIESHFWQPVHSAPSQTI